MDSSVAPAPKTHAPTRLGWILLALLAIALTRRYAQFAYPQVWDEEGVIFNGFLKNGWREFLKPVNGYFITLPKLFLWIGYRFAFSHMPLVSAWLAWAYALGVGLLVAWAPTSLERRGLCALALFAVPTDPEVFGIALYSLWWTTIPIFIALLWESSWKGFWLRLGFIVVSALSSPAMPALLPIFYYRVIRGRHRRSDGVLALVATLLSLVQIHAILRGDAMDPAPFAVDAREVPIRFVGMFLTGGLTGQAWAPLLAAGLMIATALWALCVDRSKRELRIVLLVMVLASIGMSCLRTPIVSMHPVVAGPRYFFYAYTLELWFLLQLTASPSRWLPAVAIGLIGFSLFNGAHAWRRTHADLAWTETVNSAPKFKDINLPVEAGGDRGAIFGIDTTGAAIRGILTHDLTYASGHPTRPYRIITDRTATLSDEALAASKPVYIYAGVDTLTQLLRKGARIAYLPSPGPHQPRVRIDGDEAQLSGTMPLAGGWIFLVFDNQDLPAGFQVSIDGGDPGWKVALYR